MYVEAKKIRDFIKPSHAKKATGVVFLNRGVMKVMFEDGKSQCYFASRYNTNILHDYDVPLMEDYRKP